MIRFLKEGVSAEAAHELDAQVRATVETILADIESRGDDAVRELSDRFDSYSPPSFRLTAEEIAACVARVPEQTRADIEFAQAQVRNFAEIQRKSLTDVEVETLPGVTHGRVRPYERGHGESGRRTPHHCLRPAPSRQASRRHRRGHASGRC